MSKFIEKQVGPDYMVYDPVKDAVHVLNPSSQRVLQLAQEGLGAAAIAETLCSEFRVAPDHPVLEEVQTHLQRLTSIGLLIAD